MLGTERPCSWGGEEDGPPGRPKAALRILPVSHQRALRNRSPDQNFLGTDYACHYMEH